MAKIILGQRPKSFKRSISFPLPGEVDPGTIEVSFKYRSRTEFAAFIDEMQSAAKAESELEVSRLKDAIEKGDAASDITQADIVARQNEFNVRYLMGAVDGWNLDAEFDQAAVEQLVDEVPAAVTAIVSSYRSAIVEGRLGN